MDGTIITSSPSNSINFPNSITFKITASDSSSNIVSADLVVDLQNNNGPETHVVAFGAPQHTIRPVFQENTTGNNFVPPGATITYYWRFDDAAGT
ncbi:MAG TPA: hypothetical protein VGT44_10210, partial [Ktedonobacteraceae bacterium]|nr:hypothetical protein [Ktedonobacteraceae bacterium]